LDEVLDLRLHQTKEEEGIMKWRRRRRKGKKAEKAEKAEGEEREKEKFAIPTRVEWIGSLAEYIQSLPDVEDDWFKQSFKNK
jgi:hypothetical protein